MLKKIDLKTDSYFRAWVNQPCELNQHNLTCWQAEAFRRYVAYFTQDKDSSFRYDTDDPLWYWDANMIKEVISILDRSGDISKSVWDEDGPGIGMHYFNNPSNNNGQALGLLEPMDDETDRYVIYRFAKISADGSVVFLSERVVGDGQILLSTHIPLSKDDGMMDLLIVMQALLKSKVIEIQERKAPRAFRRRGKKNNMPLDHAVRVVTWRKTYANKISDSPRQIGEDKHWWVKGHVRNQWYKSKGCHHAKYIFPHVKGNPDAPLHESKPLVNHVVK